MPCEKSGLAPAGGNPSEFFGPNREIEMDSQPVERPNTVAGLIEKRREIAGKIEHHQRVLNDASA